MNRLGTREPHIYGTTTLADVEAMCRKAAGRHPLEFRQTNAEHQLIDWIHEAIDRGAGIVINPAGLSFRSVPVVDALKMCPFPVIEVHVSNIHARDELHRRSIVSQAVTGVIAGLGVDGYPMAVEALLGLLARK
jgi:3-dehydroquinate dehydratase-2